MTTLMFSVGIAVTFLTIWGVVMVGAYLLGGGSADAPTPVASIPMTERSVPDESDLVG